MAYLSELHPEVYHVAPRSGGLANIEPYVTSGAPRASTASGKGSRATFRSDTMTRSSTRSYSMRGSLHSSMSGQTGRSSFRSSVFSPDFGSTPASREQRIKEVLLSSTWNVLEEEDDEEVRMTPDPVRNVMTIQAIAISTIMLMSRAYKDIPIDHLRWTLSYLQCVKDEFGENPPNVRGILNNIRLIDDTLESFLESDEEDGGVLDAATEPPPDEIEVAADPADSAGPADEQEA